MGQKRKIRLVEMANDEKGTVVGLLGGAWAVSKLEALGIRVGVNLVKKSSFIARGPVVVTVGGTEIAMGYGMAAKILLEVDD